MEHISNVNVNEMGKIGLDLQKSFLYKLDYTTYYKMLPSYAISKCVCFIVVWSVFILSQIGNTYNIPIRLWILDSHPFAPPICFLKPTANMGISVGKHVDAQGRIYLPYLQNWSHVRSSWIFFQKFLFVWVFIFDPSWSK